jgi:DNA (cytosine-5)-methyltransferase 1
LGRWRRKLTAVDLFCGSGAVTAAMRRHGYRVLAAVDSDPVACETYKLNHPRTKLFPEDIRLVDPDTIRGVAGGPIDLLVVCAPCQPFSSHRRGYSDDPRAELLLQAIRFAQALEPAAILFENVPGLTRPGNEGVVRKLASGLSRVGYALSPVRKVDAADLGVPQRRLRCVMVAARRGAALEEFANEALTAPPTTVRETIGHLEPLASGERSVSDPMHFARTHQPIVLERLKHIPVDGGSRSELPDALRLECHRGRGNSYSDVYGRMRWDTVAPTLTTGCTDLTRGRYAHPEQDRAITLREAALLQTFPPGYLFHGNSGDVARQIGNAVPVAMVERMLPAIDRVILAARG